MPTQTLGNFTANVPRRTQKGPPRLSKGERTATDVYTVWIPGGLHPYEAGVTGIPAIGDAWDIDDAYECEEVTWSNTFPDEYWTAAVRYRLSSVSQGTDDPTDEPPAGIKLGKITYSPSAWRVDCEYDADTGAAVANVIGDRFQDALASEVYTTSVTIETTEAAVPIGDFSHQGTVNDDTVTVGGITIPPYCGLFTISVRETDDADYPFAVTRTIQIATNKLPPTTSQNYLVTEPGESEGLDEGMDFGHRALLLNTGYRHYEDASHAEPPTRFLDDDPVQGKIPAVDPHMLDEFGVEASEGLAYWIAVNRYPSSDWGDITWLPKGKPKKHGSETTEED